MALHGARTDAIADALQFSKRIVDTGYELTTSDVVITQVTTVDHFTLLVSGSAGCAVEVEVAGDVPVATVSPISATMGVNAVLRRDLAAEYVGTGPLTAFYAGFGIRSSLLGRDRIEWNAARLMAADQVFEPFDPDLGD
jgi:hypothetical protein